LSRSRQALALLLASVAFAAALASRGSLSIWVGTGAAAVVAAAVAAWAAGGRLRELLRPRGAALVVGLASGALLAAVSHLAYRLAVDTVPMLRPLVAALYGELRATPGPLAALPILAVVVLAEELVWRGLAVDVLAAARLGPLAQVAGSTLLYAAPLAFSGSPVLVLVGTSCGVVWSALRVTTGGLAAPLTCHLVWAVAVLVAWPLPPP
jgi:uncharacterized protein